jgi:hypothetical protein
MNDRVRRLKLESEYRHDVVLAKRQDDDQELRPHR